MSDFKDFDVIGLRIVSYRITLLFFLFNYARNGKSICESLLKKFREAIFPRNWLLTSLDDSHIAAKSLYVY